MKGIRKTLLAAGMGTALLGLSTQALADNPIQSEQALKPAVVYATQQGDRLTLERDSAVSLRLDQFVSSQLSAEGERIRFLVSEPVVAKGFVVAPRGARAYGVIREVKPARGWGRGGKLIMDLTHVEAYDGTKIPLSTTMRGVKGQDLGKTGAYAAGMLLAPVSLLVAPVGAGIKGKKIEIAEGTLFTAFVKEDVSWELAKEDGALKLPGKRGTSRIGEGGPMDTSLQGECMTDICSQYSGAMFRTCMSKCMGE